MNHEIIWHRCHILYLYISWEGRCYPAHFTDEKLESQESNLTMITGPDLRFRTKFFQILWLKIGSLNCVNIWTLIELPNITLPIKSKVRTRNFVSRLLYQNTFSYIVFWSNLFYCAFMAGELWICPFYLVYLFLQNRIVC